MDLSYPPDFYSNKFLVSSIKKNCPNLQQILIILESFSKKWTSKFITEENKIY